MYDDLMPDSSALSRSLSGLNFVPFPILVELCKVSRGHSIFFARGQEALLSRVEQAGDSSSEGTRLIPAPVGKRRVVRCRGRQMPCLIRSVQTRTMSSSRQYVES